MNHYMKRLLALLLCFAMLLPMFPDVVFAAVSAPSGLTAVEAENRFCAIWNTFTNVEGNGSRTDCSGGSMVGSGSHGKNIAFDDLKQTADLSDTAYVKWLVEAPADGNYNISLRYLLKTTSISNNTSFTSTPYATFFVNGETAYKANFQGKNNWVSNTDSVSVSLKKGVNEIVAIPLVKDVIQSLGGSCWANVDCLYIQNTLTSVKNVVEAENTDYTVWNSYSTTESNTNASGGIQVGGANTDSNVHYADLQAGVDLSSTAYVKWTVDAPAAGNYDIAARAHISISGSHTGSLKEKVYVTFFVNGQTPYKAAFNGEKGWVYDTQTVSVALNEGKNEIIAIPLVRDIFDDLSLTWGWANMDCLYMDTRLQAVENEKMPAMQTVEAENTLYASWNSYTKSEENVNASGGVLVGSGNQAHNIAYADLTEGVDLSETAYVKWTVHAPHAGAYYIGLRYQPYANRYGNNQAMDPKAYASFFINGKDAYQAAFTGKSNWVSDTQPIQVNLAAGDNEIVAIALVKELLEAYEGGWANIDCLYIQEGLTPVKNRIEAENTTYAVWNNFETTENRTDASNGVIVGGGKHGKNSSFAELKADADLSDTAYIKWYVEAPADGAYAVALRYLMKVNGISNNAELDPQAYAVFFVNGKTPYKAVFTGKNGWVSDTQSVTLTLKKGINEIIAIPLVKDIITALGESWANVDCLYLDTRLTPKVPEAPAVLKPVEAENTLYAQWNNYSTVEGPRADAHAGGYLVGGAKLENNLLYSQLTEGADLSGTAYIQWTVTAPEDGEYAIGLRYLMNAKPLPSGELLDSGAYCTFFINGKDVYRADFTGKDNWVSDTKTVEVTLKKGENKIIAIPFIRDLMDSYGAQDPGYANVDCLYIEDTLKAVPAVKLEAEDTQSAGWNQFDTTLEHTAASGNTLVSGETAQNVAFDDLSAGVDLTDTAYIRWTLTAPADGEYYVALRYLSELNEDAYAAVFVNGETAYKAVFLGENNSIGDTQTLRLTLRKGSNTLVVIPVTAEQTGTAKVDCLYIDSRLSAERNRLEAENSIYTAWNVYNKVENNKSASAGAVVGGGDASRNIYYADLIPGVKLGKSSFVKWKVEAPADGEYTIALRYSVKADKKDNDTRLSPAAYAAFFVNGETAYKAQFMGKNNWVYDTETITLTLHAGTNEIIAVPLVKDLYDAWGGGWANVDCVYLDGKLTVLRAPEIIPDYITVEAEDQTKTTWNIYSTTETNHDASGKTTVGGSDASKNVYFADLVPGVKLGNTAYVKWAVNAPADGEYTVALRYQVKAGNQSNNTDLDPAAYAVFFVNGKAPYQATFQGKNNWTYDTETITVTLKKGRNEIVAIPLIRDLVDAYSWGYANVDCVYLDGKLTVLAAPEIPADDRPDPAPHKIEAEDQTKTAWNIYSTTETNHDASGKTTVGGSDAS
ncbi:MAG: hypothetical protein IJO28_00490, partial [Oscillospiraceae bacterium]|nr:hypothetical protein [Oscillospiraceae bacterium]